MLVCLSSTTREGRHDHLNVRPTGSRISYLQQLRRTPRTYCPIQYPQIHVASCLEASTALVGLKEKEEVAADVDDGYVSASVKED